MSTTVVLAVIFGYFLLLIAISWLTAGKGDAETFFTGNRQSPWYLVAFGMIGASLSGVTFISVPGWVEATGFTYMQMVFGYLAGYLVIGTILMPLYYKLNLVSIYQYLDQRFGPKSYKTGAFFFLLSRTIGAAFRLFLVAGVLQIALFDTYGIPFWVSVLVTILLIWVYTFRGGIKTIVWTDTLQTLFMLVAVGVSIVLITDDLDISMAGIGAAINETDYGQWFEWDWSSSRHFAKQFISGAFIAIVMTGLDQDMMQKNLTCKSLGEAQKNMFWFSIVLVFVNIMFLALGALLFMYAGANGIAIPERTDDLFPILALDHFSLIAGITFLLGITAAAYSSADSALTALTTSFCVDFLGHTTETNNTKQRRQVHIGFSVLLFLVILVFRAISNDSVIAAVFTAAGYTYGPLLGMYAFGLFTKRQVQDKAVPWVGVISPILAYGVNYLTDGWFGFSILLVNGAFTFVGLLLVTKRD